MEQADACGLNEYDDHEESTARHDVPSVHVHVHSDHDIDVDSLEPPKSGVKKLAFWGLAALAVGFFSWLSGKFGLGK